jgi:acetylornithine/succinyldiaminopimelate/putrescine aminotransferase
MNPQLPKVLKTIGFDKVYVKGEGAYLWDQNGERYLDMLSGYGVFNIGRYHPVLVKTMHEMLEIKDANMVQMDCPHLTGELAKALAAKNPRGGRVYFCSTGAETVETSIKFAKAHTKRDRILFLDHGFHGLTVGALSVMGNQEFREGFGQLLHETSKIPFNDLGALEYELKKKDVAAFIFEPIQGKGVYTPAPGFLKAAEDLCRKYGAVTICDEVQSGMARTGTFFAFEHEGISPDIILLSKALSGGLVPTGAVLATDEIFNSVFSRMDRCVVHSSTFGKNSLSAAMGLATLWVIENERIAERSRSIGDRIISGLKAMSEEFEMLGDVRGRGCMIGVEFKSPSSFKLKAAWHLIHTLNKGLFPQLVTIPLLRDHRILSQTSGHNQDIIKFLPPCILSDEDVAYFLNGFRQTMELIHTVPGGVWDLGKTLAKAAMSTSNSNTPQAGAA